MFKKVLFTIFKYVVYLTMTAILIAFLAKTGNMPAAVPTQYVEKIVELTDRLLISLKLVKDKNLIMKYSKAKEMIKKSTDMPIAVDASHRIENTFFEKLYDWTIFNGYNIEQDRILNDISDKWNAIFHNHISKLDSFAENPYVKSVIIESKSGIIDNYTESFFDSLLDDLKLIAGFSLIENNNIIKIFKKNNSSITKNFISKLTDIPNNGIRLASMNGNRYFVYSYSLNSFGNNSGYKILFFLLPNYFLTMPADIYHSDNLFLFDDSRKIISFNGNDKNLLPNIENGIEKTGFIYNNKSYKIRYIKLPVTDGLYLGYFYRAYPLWKLMLNIFVRVLILGLFIGVIYFIKIFIKKLRATRTKDKNDEIEIITGAMMEVAKSIKLAADTAQKATQYARFESENVKKIVENLKKAPAVYVAESNEVSVGRKQVDKGGWKLIE